MNGYIGPHDELVINQDGAYYQLIQLQESPKEVQKMIATYPI
jgi:hypothetical protein